MAANRLLVLDDEAASAALVARLAEGCGFTTRMAADAGSFWRAYDAFHPTLIIADLDVAGAEDGGIVDTLADRGCTARIMITNAPDGQAIALVAEIGRARGLAMVEPMAKPFRLGALRARLTELATEAGG